MTLRSDAEGGYFLYEGPEDRLLAFIEDCGYSGVFDVINLSFSPQTYRYAMIATAFPRAEDAANDGTGVLDEGPNVERVADDDS